MDKVGRVFLAAALLAGLGLVSRGPSARAAVQPADAPVIIYMPQIATDFSAKVAGVFMPLEDNKTWPGNVDTFVNQTGKRHGLYLVSVGFKCPWVDQISKIQTQLTKIRDLGALPLITWMPMDCKNGFGDINALGLPDILAGTWDAYLTQFGQDVAALGYPVLVRWGHEMNIPSYAWSAQRAFGVNGKTAFDQVQDACGLSACYGDPAVPDGPERYVAAYRHVHDVVAPLAPNILWVWNPNGQSYPPAAAADWNDYHNYYPGDTYVDWVGPDGYNWGDGSGNGYGHWVTFSEMFDGVLKDLAARYPDKSQIIPEFASVEDAVDPNRKAAWITDAYQTARAYPNLRVISWVQDASFVDGFRSPPAPALFNVDSSPQALAAYQAALRYWSSAPPLP